MIVEQPDEFKFMSPEEWHEASPHLYPIERIEESIRQLESGEATLTPLEDIWLTGTSG